MIAKLLLSVVALLIVLALGVTGLLYHQGRTKPSVAGDYVALGSSYAAGVGLGPRQPGSPLVCARSVNGYPSLLARRLGLSLVDMACSGSTTTHILDGGQMFLGPQLAAVGPAARLVTITSGGNDVHYIGDLLVASGRGGAIARMLVGTIKPLAARDFGRVTDNLVRIVARIRERAPQARIVIVSYPTVLPPAGSCDTLGIAADKAALSRQVAARLDVATRSAAERTGALFVDMGRLSVGHDACSPRPWVNGDRPKAGVAFHPNADGAHAVANAVANALGAVA